VSSRVTRARAAVDPTAALEVDEEAWLEEPTMEVVAGVPAPERIVRAHAMTMAVEVEPPGEFSRWRFLVFYALVRLAAWVYPFQFEIYRTRRPWE
jgi:hypothetical protein